MVHVLLTRYNFLVYTIKVLSFGTFCLQSCSSQICQKLFYVDQLPLTYGKNYKKYVAVGVLVFCFFATTFSSAARLVFILCS